LAPRPLSHIAEDDDIIMELSIGGQAIDDDIIASLDIIELSIEDMQSIEDIIELSIIELDESWARLGTAAAAMAPATSRAAAIESSFFIFSLGVSGFDARA
jgi:hypothetical protein